MILNDLLRFYKGYVMRIYHNSNGTEREKLCDIFCENDNVDLCDSRKCGKEIRTM